jgi:MFS family permease
MDATTIGIALGITGSTLYALTRAYARRSFELNHTVLIFLAAFSVPGGVALIAAGFIGNAGSLPSSWREHVTVAGIVAIGLAVHYIFTAFRDCWPSREKVDEQGAASEVDKQ